MSAYGTKLAEGFSQKLMKEVYDRDLTDVVVNRDYEGDINGVGSKLNILNFDRLSEKTYTGADLTADSLTENNTQLVIDQYKSFYWKEKTLDRWLSYIKNPHATIVQQKADERAKNMDEFVFGLYGDVWAGNRVGTDYTTGTVAIDASGNVTGSNTVFTSAMVGRGFKALGHTTWYRVKSYASGTSIVIENDKDDVTSAYSGGVINAGATYTIQGATVATITVANILAQVGQLKLKLDLAESYGFSAVPQEDRWLVLPPEGIDILTNGATGIHLHVDEVYEDLVKRGMMGMLKGFKVFMSNRLTGNNTDGYRVLAGHGNWCTFAEKLLEADMEEDLIGNFGSAYKDLFVYGAKVTDTRRHFATEGFWKFA